MNRIIFTATLLLAASVLAVAADDHTITTKALDPVKDDAFIPTRLPGYELRELNRKRTLTYAIDAETEVKLTFPLLVYFPTNDGAPRPEIPELRRLYNDLAEIVARTSDDDGQKVLLRLDRILADMGEKRDIPANYSTVPQAKQPQTKSRVISEKRISTDTMPNVVTPTPMPVEVPVVVAANPEIVVQGMAISAEPLEPKKVRTN